MKDSIQGTQLKKEQFLIEHSQLLLRSEVIDIVNSIKLDAFKAGAEWATAHPSIPPEIEEEIKFMASSLKEIPK